VECELRTEGRAIDLTLGVDLVAYRVIEAVLHSAAQHRSRSAIVIIRYRPHELELDIRGDGSGPDLDRELEGIVQRVALYDGSLRTLPANGDGFALQARLPVPEAVPA
jgi:signal transduction histidine kinase